MKIAVYDAGAGPRIGVVLGDRRRLTGLGRRWHQQ